MKGNGKDMVMDYWKKHQVQVLIIVSSKISKVCKERHGGGVEMEWGGSLVEDFGNKHVLNCICLVVLVYTGYRVS